MKKDIKITVNSLVIKILGNVYIDKFVKSMKKLHLDKTWQEKINQFPNSVLSHTDVIDCGKKNIDSNRETWDMLCQEFYKDILFCYWKKIHKIFMFLKNTHQYASIVWN